MISTRNKNPLAKKAEKAGSLKDGLTGRKLGYFLGNKFGMGGIKGQKNTLIKLADPSKRY